MGLAMFLEREVYIGANYKHNKITGTIDLFQDGEPLNLSTDNITEINYRVGYWRKANHIHQWFVQEVQDGIDECQRSYVGNDKIRELYELCLLVFDKLDDAHMTAETQKTYGGESYEVEVYDNKEKIKELLPTTCGFFFGSCTIDKYYKQDIQDTIEILEPLLDCEDSIFYQASW